MSSDTREAQDLTAAARALLADYPDLAGLEYGRTGEPILEAIEREARGTEPDFLDGARLEYRECMEVRRLLGYLWNATGKNHLRPVYDLFAPDDPIVADVDRLAIFPESA